MEARGDGHGGYKENVRDLRDETRSCVPGGSVEQCWAPWAPKLARVMRADVLETEVLTQPASF